MELEIIRKSEIDDENKTVDLKSNESLPYSSYDFIDNNKVIAIPYLSFISLLTFVGTLGNMLVLGTLLINKVSV